MSKDRYTYIYPSFFMILNHRKVILKIFYFRNADHFLHKKGVFWKPFICLDKK